MVLSNDRIKKVLFRAVAFVIRRARIGSEHFTLPADRLAVLASLLWLLIQLNRTSFDVPVEVGESGERRLQASSQPRSELVL
jgi:hypothetical protein